MQYTFFIVLKIYIVLKKKFVGSTHLGYGKSYEAWYGKLQTFKNGFNCWPCDPKLVVRGYRLRQYFLQLFILIDSKN